MTILSFLHEILENWTLVSLFSIFAFVVLWSFRPGSRALHDDAANVVFRQDDSRPVTTCGACPGCCGCVVPSPLPEAKANG